MKNKYIGMNDGELVFQNLDSSGLIKGFETFYPVELVDGRLVLSPSSWCHSVGLDHVDGEFKSGMPACVVLDIPSQYADCYACDTVVCIECCAVHDSDDSEGHSSSPTWTIINECEAICLSCRMPEHVMTLISEPSDLFKSKNLKGVDLGNFEEIETLFCDSSGFGSESERALTKKQAKSKVIDLIKEHGELYSGLTGIGQFQVYVTLFKKRPN